MLGNLPEKGWKVLIVDKYTLSVISAACKISDLMQKNITVVESLEKKRQPFPQMEAVYFIAPVEESAKLILDDIDKKRYGTFHLFFSSVADKNTIKIVGSSKNSKSIQTCFDLNLDFLAVEGSIFTLKQEDDIKRTFFSSGELESYSKLLADKVNFENFNKIS